MVKLQIGANTIYLTKQEQDFLFQLLDNNYDHIENSPTFNAIHNWLSELGCRPEVLRKTPEEMQKEVADYFADVAKKIDEKKETSPFNEKWSYTDSKLNQETPMVENPWGDLQKSKAEMIRIVNEVHKQKKQTIEDPWGNPETLKPKQELKDLYKEWSGVDLSKTTDYTALRKLLGELLKDDNEKGYYVAL